MPSNSYRYPPISILTRPIFDYEYQWWSRKEEDENQSSEPAISVCMRSIASHGVLIMGSVIEPG